MAIEKNVVSKQNLRQELNPLGTGDVCHSKLDHHCFEQWIIVRYWAISYGSLYVLISLLWTH